MKSQPKSGLQEETPADFLEVELLREHTQSMGGALKPELVNVSSLSSFNSQKINNLVAGYG